MLTEFQLTRSRGARQAIRSEVTAELNFNSRAHVERDAEDYGIGPKRMISTHALTWSATFDRLYKENIKMISTHALTWSATSTLAACCAGVEFQLTRSRGARRRHYHRYTFYILFQLTRSRGARPIDMTPFVSACEISTHALTWSATSKVCGSMRLDRFQLTRSRGARLYIFLFYFFYINFNSRAHVERDAVAHLAAEEVGNFNSRAHVERDGESAKRHPARGISTHALTWSATGFDGGDGFRVNISTHALTWSATRYLRHRRVYLGISTHALTWSATSFQEILQVMSNISTHALTWSATRRI